MTASFRDGAEAPALLPVPAAAAVALAATSAAIKQIRGRFIGRQLLDGGRIPLWIRLDDGREWPWPACG
jgi:hypothetical protein